MQTKLSKLKNKSSKKIEEKEKLRLHQLKIREELRAKEKLKEDKKKAALKQVGLSESQLKILKEFMI